MAKHHGGHRAHHEAQMGQHPSHHERKRGGHVPETKEEEKKEEHRKHGGHLKHHRAHGGGMPKDTTQVEHEYMHEGTTPGARKKGGHVGRKHGGHVPGKHEGHRPDRKHRASGGGTADMHPTTTAGKMTELPYMRAQQPTDEHGMGKDRD